MPREGEKVTKGDPFTIIDKKYEEVSDIIHLIKVVKKPKARRM
jgi:hypothetical protein